MNVEQRLVRLERLTDRPAISEADIDWIVRQVAAEDGLDSEEMRELRREIECDLAEMPAGLTLRQTAEWIAAKDGEVTAEELLADAERIAAGTRGRRR